MRLDRRQFVLGLIGTGVALGVGACTSTTEGGVAPDAASTGSGAAAGDTTTSTPSITAPPSTSPPTAPPPLGPARYVNRGDASTPRAALTFHTEGSATQVGRLLDMAASLEVPLTMLVVGSWLDQHRSLGARIADDGHDLGNHTWSHLSLPDQKRDVVASEITRCADMLRTVTGTGGVWFRPSGSNSTTTLINEEAGRAGYPIVLGFDTDPVDYEDPGSAVVRTRVVNGVRNGSIVSLHAQHQGTIDVFESMVAAIRAKGFTLVRATDLVR